MAEVDPTAMEVATEVIVHTSASATALGGQAPTGVGPPIPLRPSLPDDGQHGHHDATRSNATTQSTPSLTQPQQRRDSQQVEEHRTPAKGGGNAATTSVGPSPRADRGPHANFLPHGNFPCHSPQTADTQQQPNAPEGSGPSPTIHSHEYAQKPIHYPLNTIPALVQNQNNASSAFTWLKPTRYSCPSTTCAVDHGCHERRLCGIAWPFQCKPFSGRRSTIRLMLNPCTKGKAKEKFNTRGSGVPSRALSNSSKSICCDVGRDEWSFSNAND